MNNFNFIKENLEVIKKSIKRRGLNVDIDGLAKLDNERRVLIPKIDAIRALINQSSKQKPTEEEIGKIKKEKEDLDRLEAELKQTEVNLGRLASQIPNLVSDESPDGGEDDYKVLKEWGQKPDIKNPKDHEELGKDLDLIDFDSGAKIAGAKFYFLKNQAAILEFALINYVMKILTNEDFIPMVTPQIVKNEILEGIGFNPKGPEKQVYGIDEEGLSLIGTAEVSLGGYHKDEILDFSKLPVKYAGFSTCFRTEAGSYGRHSKGLYRVHQFDKVEMFIYCLPDDSEKMHQYLLSLEETIFQGLGIPYRVIEIAAGDLGASAFRKFDIEAWMSGRGDWGEVTSTSNTTNFQAMRLNIKYQKDDSRDYVHTLNGTAIAISRALIALLENYQQEDGSIKIPGVLVPYTNFSEIKPKR